MVIILVLENCAHSTYQCLFSLVPFFADSLHLIFVHIYARVLKCEGVLISEFKHMSLNARKYGTTNSTTRPADIYDPLRASTMAQYGYSPLPLIYTMSCTLQHDFP